MNDTYTIRDEKSSLRINRRGLHLDELILDGIEILMESEDDSQTHGGCAFLIPYANRIRNGTYSIGSREFHLKKNAEGNSIHGFAKDIPWNVEVTQTNRAVGRCKIKGEGYPFELNSTIEMELNGNSLNVKMSFLNLSSQAIPLSPGAHPYFLTSESWNISCEFGIDEVEYKDGFFPNGIMKPVNDPNRFLTNSKNFDNCFKGGGKLRLNDGERNIVLERNNMDYFVIYNGKFASGRSVAIEPMVAPPDAFNNGISLVMLKSGEKFNCGFTISTEEK